MNTRPIPLNRVDTMFYACVGTAPEWFVRDEVVVSARKFSSVERALEWAARVVARGEEISRIVAPGEDGVMYWVRSADERIALNAFGVPDFSANEPAY